MRIFENRGWQMLAWPLAGLYELAVSCRNRLYDSGRLEVVRLPTFVISIGNITMGGTGKTPATIALARRLSGEGLHVAVLSRGYGRSTRGPVVVSDGRGNLCDVEKGGDEPLLIAHSLPHIPVVVDEDRVRGGRLLLQQFAPEVVLLDDGFQHRRLARDLDIVLLDAAAARLPRLLPAGPGREPARSLRRAQQIWLVRKNFGGQDAKRGLLQSITAVAPGTDTYDVEFRPVRLLDPGKNQGSSPGDLAGRRVYGLAGIARPENFRNMLEELGADIIAFQAEPDHKNFTQKDMRRILTRFGALRAEWCVTTAKDWVKMSRFEEAAQLPLRVLEIALQLPDAAVRSILAGVQQHAKL